MSIISALFQWSDHVSTVFDFKVLDCKRNIWCPLNVLKYQNVGFFFGLMVVQKKIMVGGQVCFHKFEFSECDVVHLSHVLLNPQVQIIPKQCYRYETFL